MRSLLALGAVAVWALALSGSTRVDEPIVLVLSGDTDGYLSPCGCSKPMSGGIRRRVTAIRTLTAGKKSVVLDNGGLVNGQSRQDQIKAETLAESLGAIGIAAINLSGPDASLGQGMVLSLNQLSGGKLVSSVLEPSPTNEVSRFVQAGPFLVGGATSDPASLAANLSETPVDLEAAVRQLIQEAEGAGLAPILLLHGDRELAASLARSFPNLRLIQYRSSGAPPDGIEWIGQTALVSPGERGRHILRLVYERGKLGGYAAVKLDPEFEDDASTARRYDFYLDRVRDEKLLEALPRIASPAFSGNDRCGSCHAESDGVWKGSKHAEALKTLELDKHDRDPDCTGCHVVGLEAEKGFRSRAETPQLANVGCESCHGAGEAHSLDPSVQMGKVGEKACAPCHNPDHSPNFNFPLYWAKIAHK